MENHYHLAFQFNSKYVIISSTTIKCMATPLFCVCSTTEPLHYHAFHPCTASLLEVDWNQKLSSGHTFFYDENHHPRAFCNDYWRLKIKLYFMCYHLPDVAMYSNSGFHYQDRYTTHQGAAVHHGSFTCRRFRSCFTRQLFMGDFLKARLLSLCRVFGSDIRFQAMFVQLINASIMSSQKWQLSSTRFHNKDDLHRSATTWYELRKSMQLQAAAGEHVAKPGHYICCSSSSQIKLTVYLGLKFTYWNRVCLSQFNSKQT